MADDATDVPGVTTRTLRGTTFLLVSMKDAFRTNLPEIAIGDFADFVKLPAEEVFKQLLQNPRNVDTVKWLWKSQVKTPLTDLRKARAQLGKLGHKPVIVDQFASHASLDFLGWGLSRTQIPVVVVSQSDGFKEVMRAASEKRATQFRVALTQPVFDALNAKVKEIDKLVIDLNLAIGGLTAFAKTNAREFQILMALQSLLLALINHPKNPNEAQSHKDDLEIVRKRVKNLADFARKDLMTDPPNSSDAKKRNDGSLALKNVLCGQEFADLYQKLIDNKDIAPAQTWQDVHDAVRNGFTSLLGSDRANEVLDDHLEPAITLVASMNVGDLSAVHVSKADLEAAMKTAPVAPAATASILTRMVTVLSNLTANVGNAPGPSTTLTALVAIAAPMFVARKLNARSDAMTFAGKLYRYLIKVADLSPQQFNTVAQAAEEAISADQSATLAILRTKIDWTTRFHNSATWGMALGIANLFCFCAAVTDTESDTLRRWSNIMSSGTGTALGFSVAAGRFSALIEQGIVKGVGGKILGVVGGVAVIMQGAASIRDAEDVDDKLGIGFGVASVAGGVLSVAGFLCAAGIAADATIVGAPAGTVLMACGAILGAGAAAGDAIRSSFIASTQDIFQHYLKDEFDRDGGPFRQVCPSDSTGGERSAFKDCMDHDHWSFYPVHPDQAAALWDVGFANADAIVKMCDANEAEEKVIRFNLLSRIQGH